MSGAAVELDGVRKVYRTRGADIAALEDVGLTVGRGEFLAVVGRSGCGKTTLLKVVAGLLPPTAGAVAVEGQPVRGPLRNVGLVALAERVVAPWGVPEQEDATRIVGA